VLNVSEPAGHSSNECVDSSKREKVKMDAAGSFTYKLREADKGACMDKTDPTEHIQECASETGGSKNECQVLREA
jgi:hypothetical protein